MEPKKTVFFELEKNLNAHFIDFAGWQLPVYYSGIIKEQGVSREKAGIFDVSHMGKIKISGPKVQEFISKVTCNDPSLLKPGQIQYSMILNESGGAKDDLLLYRFEKYFLLVVNAANTEKILEWLQSRNEEAVQIEDLTRALPLLAVQGPGAEKILLALAGESVIKTFYYHFFETELEKQKIIISRTGYTGEDGFEIFCGPTNAEKIWKKIFEIGQEFGLAPAGLGARDILRIEAALPLYGHELNEEITPLEAGFEWVVKFKKKNFTGLDALNKQKKTGLPGKLCGIIMEEKMIPRQNYPVFDETGKIEIGRVTSGTFSPSLGLAVAMAFLKPEKINIGAAVKVFFKEKFYSGRVVELPFYRHRTKKFKEVK